MDRSVPLSQWLEELPAQVLEPVVVPALHLCTIMAVELLDHEVFAQTMSCCHLFSTLLFGGRPTELLHGREDHPVRDDRRVPARLIGRVVRVRGHGVVPGFGPAGR